MNREELYDLIRKYQDNTATEAEKQRLLEWYRSTAYQDAWIPEQEEAVHASMLDSLMASITTPARPMPARRKWLVAASIAIAVLAGGGIVLLLQTRKKAAPQGGGPIAGAVQDIGPGANKAVLTLADGSKVSLTDASIGSVAQQNGIIIDKSGEDRIAYLPSQKSSPSTAAPEQGAPVFNKIEIPPGGQFCVVLPDSSRVWLNAASSLRFPVQFVSGERRVELSGEAYFEVAANKMAPFRVSCPNQEVEVLGTHFNIHAYADETHTRTTLLTGSVRVDAGGNSALLKPDQQADLYDKLVVRQVDAEDAIAWKNGYFRWDEERLEIIMKSISRWYNVRIDYENEQLKDEPFGILSTRFTNLSALLKLMEQTGSVHFVLEGSVIHIKKKI